MPAITAPRTMNGNASQTMLVKTRMKSSTFRMCAVVFHGARRVEVGRIGMRVRRQRVRVSRCVYGRLPGPRFAAAGEPGP